MILPELSMSMWILLYFGGMFVYMILFLGLSWLLSRSKRAREGMQNKFGIYKQDYETVMNQRESRLYLSLFLTLIYPISIVIFAAVVLFFVLIELYRNYAKLHNKFWRAQIYKEVE